MEHTTKFIDDTESDFDFHLVELESDSPVEDAVMNETKNENHTSDDADDKKSDMNIKFDHFHSKLDLDSKDSECVYSSHTQKLMKDVENILSFSKEIKEQVNRIPEKSADGKPEYDEMIDTTVNHKTTLNNICSEKDIHNEEEKTNKDDNDVEQNNDIGEDNDIMNKLEVTMSSNGDIETIVDTRPPAMKHSEPDISNEPFDEKYDERRKKWRDIFTNVFGINPDKVSFGKDVVLPVSAFFIVRYLSEIGALTWD